MKVHEMISLLETYEPEDEVMIAFQPSWPLAYTVANVVGNAEVEHDEDYTPEDDAFNGVVWIVESGENHNRSPYAPGAVFNY